MENDFFKYVGTLHTNY